MVIIFLSFTYDHITFLSHSFFFSQLVAVSVLSWFYADSCDPNKIMWSQHNHVIPTKSCDHNIIMWSQQNHVITTCHTVQIRSFLFNMRYLNRDKLWLGLFGCGWKTQICSFPSPNIYICGIINEQMHSCPSIVIQMNNLLDNIP